MQKTLNIHEFTVEGRMEALSAHKMEGRNRSGYARLLSNTIYVTLTTILASYAPTTGDVEYLCPKLVPYPNQVLAAIFMGQKPT